MVVMLSLAASAATAQQIVVSSDPQEVVVHYQSWGGMSYRNFHLRIFGDGRVRVSRQTRLVTDETGESWMAFEELMDLLQTLAARGVMQFDDEEAMDALTAEQKRRIENREPIQVVTDLPWESVEIHLRSYTPIGSGVSTTPFENSISIRGLGFLAEEYPQVRGFADLDSAFAELRSLLRELPRRSRN